MPANLASCSFQFLFVQINFCKKKSCSFKYRSYYKLYSYTASTQQDQQRLIIPLAVQTE